MGMALSSDRQTSAEPSSGDGTCSRTSRCVSISSTQRGAPVSVSDFISSTAERYCRTAAAASFSETAIAASWERFFESEGGGGVATPPSISSTVFAAASRPLAR